MPNSTRWRGLFFLFAGCLHPNAVPRTDQLFVRGKAYECVDSARPLSSVAVGKRVQLVVGQEVLDEDVVGPDGSFVLHPKKDSELTGTVFLVAGESRVSLGNDYASWLQNNITTHVNLTFGCGGKEAVTTLDDRPQSPALHLPSPSPRLAPR